jgi:hypothetical protein
MEKDFDRWKIELPQDAKVRVDTGMQTSDGWEIDYSVRAEVPKAKPQGPDDKEWPEARALVAIAVLRENADADSREKTLKIALSSVKVHHVKAVEFNTEEYEVSRHTSDERGDEF